MNAILENLRKIGAERSPGFPDELFQLRGMWRIDYQYRPNRYERMLNYSIFMAQTTAQGASYAQYGSEHIDIDEVMGHDARELVVESLPVQIAITDSVFGVFKDEPDEEYSFTGTSNEKAVKRAAAIVQETRRILDSVGGKTVLHVGVMGNFVHQLAAIGIDVVCSDFDEDLVTNGINGAMVKHGNGTVDYIDECDVVLATGMTLATDTLEPILDRAQDCGKKVVLYAATGGFFGREYCRSFGVDVVISEPQPQYMFQGESVLWTYRR